VQNDLESRELKQLAEVDYFRLIDQRVLSELANKVLGRTLSAGECTQVIRSRRRGHWYREYADLYEAVGYAAELLHMLNSMSLALSSIEQGITACLRWLAVQDRSTLSQVHLPQCSRGLGDILRTSESTGLQAVHQFVLAAAGRQMAGAGR